MNLGTLIAAAAAGAEEHHGNIMLETAWYGVVAIVAFTLLGLVTFSYRDVANRHAAKAEAYAKSHGAAQGAHGGQGEH